MFYRPEDGHGLPHDPFGAIVAPRPIAWVATRGAVDNLAPYSFFNAVAYRPPQVMFASTSAKPDRGDTKDSMANIRETGVFAVSLVAPARRAQMNETSAPLPADVSEFDHAALPRAECAAIDCPRVADAPATLECRLTRMVDLEGGALVAFGEVVGVHLRPDCLVDGRFEPPGRLSRLGYRDYAEVVDTFEMARPG
ncbi:MAG: flavin reductase family protein [Paracoccaceae bacterium]